MAGDWLKVEKDTPEKPEVLAVAAKLSLDPEVVFTKCFKVWRWADSHTPDGNAMRVTPALLDALVHAPGFAQALLDVGWLHVRDGALQFPNFERHMGQSGKKRALTAKRVAAHKKRSGNDCSVTSALPREEKRRVNNTPRSPPEGGADFDQFWAVYPKKVAKQDALRAWAKLRPSPELLQTMLSALERQSRSEQWTKEGMKYAPNPATWLNGHRWEDQTSAPAAAAPSPEEYARRAAEQRRQRAEDLRLKEEHAATVREKVRLLKGDVGQPPPNGTPAERR
jgi:hypothetical protein